VLSAVIDRRVVSLIGHNLKLHANMANIVKIRFWIFL